MASFVWARSNFGQVSLTQIVQWNGINVLTKMKFCQWYAIFVLPKMIFFNGMVWYGMAQICPKWPKSAQNGPNMLKWPKYDPIGPKSLKMDQNRSKWPKYT